MGVPTKNFEYRPEIDGLRAIAILAVVLFHAGFGVPGGFVGVDVFFVISGYLITSLIMKDLHAGRFTLGRFWERRMRRIFPALAVMIVSVLIAGWFLLLPEDFSSLAASTTFQPIANVHFWRTIGYFDAPAEEVPLLHTWSLALEEQFYIIAPILLAVGYRLSGRRRNGWLIGGVMAAFAASFAMSLWITPREQSAAFYLLHTRTWELLAGAFIALLPPFSIHWAVRELLAVAGFLAILLPCFFYSHATPFPGMAALAPCLGTALFILVSRRTDASPRLPRCAQIIATRPFVFVGLISYSLYLWHWPLFAFSTYMALLPPSAELRGMLMGLSVVLAILSWRFVERPFRTKSVCPSRESLFLLCGTGFLVLVVSSVVISRQSGFPGRVPPEALRYANAKLDTALAFQIKKSDVVADKLGVIGVQDRSLPIQWLVWGDSHAKAALPAFHALLKERGESGRAATYSSTPPVLGYYRMGQFGLGADSPAFNAAVLEYVRSRGIRNVALIARWDTQDDRDRDLPGNKLFEPSLIETVKAVVKAGAQPWILLQVPSHSFDVRKGLARAAIRKTDISEYSTKPDAGKPLIGKTAQFMADLREAGAKILNPHPSFLKEGGNSYMLSKDGVSLYRDSHHLSVDGALTVLLPFLREAIPSGRQAVPTSLQPGRQ